VNGTRRTVKRIRNSFTVYRVPFIVYQKNMEKLRITDDGSATLYSPEFNQYYHSVRGAKSETQRVYIELGLWAKMSEKSEINILEIGFGTGLNALMTALEVQKNNIKVHYASLEPYPISVEESQLLNYETEFDTNLLTKIHEAKWEEVVEITPNFQLQKIKNTIQKFESNNRFDVVYFDAFAPSSQPELWTEEIFTKISSMMQKGGFLTTYCSKTVIRRALESAGFKVEKHVGMWGKREVVRAVY
jgi:tRNA U34 5-methylaminomethyl-2-thiouridine-forming methyltransferase MnmC